MKILKKYGITVLMGLAIAGLILWSKDIGSQTDPQVIFHILSDAFFIPGVLITGAGLLVFSANEGTFDMLVYGLDSFADLFRRNSTKKYPTFYDYRESRADKKVGFGFLLVCGILFLAAAGVMYLLYRRYAG